MVRPPSLLLPNSRGSESNQRRHSAVSQIHQINSGGITRGCTDKENVDYVSRPANCTHKYVYIGAQYGYIWSQWTSLPTPIHPATYVGQRCITDTEIYANKTVERHHCTLICIRDPKCQVINFNAIGSYCLLSQRTCLLWEPDGDFDTTTMPINMPCLKWFKNPENDVYKAIFSDPSATTRVARIAREENKIPGKWKVGRNIVHYSWEGL